MENDLLFEEANSISSFGESETNRTRDIFRDDDNNGNNNGGEECEEDVFVIGADGVFKGGGSNVACFPPIADKCGGQGQLDIIMQTGTRESALAERQSAD